jgi:hypothetical protein
MSEKNWQSGSLSHWVILFVNAPVIQSSMSQSPNRQYDY